MLENYIFDTNNLNMKLTNLYNAVDTLSSAMVQLRDDYIKDMLTKVPNYIENGYGFFVMEQVYSYSSNKKKKTVKLKWGRVYTWDESTNSPRCNFISGRLIINWNREKNKLVKLYKRELLDFDKKAATLNQSMEKTLADLKSVSRVLRTKPLNFIDNLNTGMHYLDLINVLPKAVHKRNRKTKPKCNSNDLVSVDFSDFN